jgi:exodeoxyribonuclease-3
VKIATWNVNSIRARLPVTLEWLDQARPDLVLLQETKVVPEQFPSEPIEERGYNIAACGEAGGRNGVAILAKSPIEDLRWVPTVLPTSSRFSTGCGVMPPISWRTRRR